MNFTASCLTLDKCDTSYAYWNASATSDCTGQQFCCNAAPATLACTSPNACSTSCSTHGVGGSCPSAAQTCCAPATTTTDKGTIPNGAHGCSFKISANVSSTTITIPPEDMLVSCQNKGICTPDNQSSAQIVNGGPEIINGLCLSTDNQCPVCYSGYQYTNQGDCVSIADYTKRKPLTRTDSCTDTQGCDPGIGCLTAGTGVLTSQALSLCNNGVSCPTALGDLPTHLPDLLTKVFSIVLSIAGVVALSLIIASGYKLMVSQGNPEQVKGAREQLTAAIIGLLFIIFSLVILQVIGVNILNIPGFK
jgi:hypothetical protein